MTMEIEEKKKKKKTKKRHLKHFKNLPLYNKLPKIGRNMEEHLNNVVLDVKMITVQAETSKKHLRRTWRRIAPDVW